MKSMIIAFGAALMAVGCRAEPSARAEATEQPTRLQETGFAGKDDRQDRQDDVKATAPGEALAVDGGIVRDAGGDAAVPGRQPMINPDVQDSKGRGPRDPRMVPGTRASEEGMPPESTTPRK